MKILGTTIEEFIIRWNKVTFQLGGLNEKFAEKLSRLYIRELNRSLKQLNINLERFFINLGRNGSISTMKVEEASTFSKIKEFYQHNIWGTSIPYTLPIALDMEPNLKGKKVLDVGCGFGRLSILCALKGASQVVAIDLSKPLIQSLNRVINILKFTNMKSYIMDAEKIDLEPNQFDIIYLCEVIEHLPNPAKVLHSIHSLLKPDGNLILSTPNGLNLVGFKRAFLKIFHYDWVSPYGAGQPELHMFTPMRIRALLYNNGFEIKTFRGAEFIDNIAILYPSKITIGMLQFLPLLFSPLQTIKNGFVRLGKTRIFKNFGLEMFIKATPLKK